MGWRKWGVRGLIVLAICAGALTGVAPNIVLASQNSYYVAARDAYLRGKTSGDLQTEANAYADAVDNVSRAVAYENRPEHLVLASLIYRSKGGTAYAKEYFNRADRLLKMRLASEPNDIGSHLDCAILYCAGDARFWPNAGEYRASAVMHADRVIELAQKSAWESICSTPCCAYKKSPPQMRRAQAPTL